MGEASVFLDRTKMHDVIFPILYKLFALTEPPEKTHYPQIADFGQVF